MAANHYLAWIVMLTALPGATTECQDKHSCNLELDADDKLPIGFLVPTLCCDEVEYPFTFLADFNTNEQNITFHLHEYYLLDTEIRMCRSDFYEIYEDNYYFADDDAIERFCVDDYPFRCLPEKSFTAPELSFRSWSDDGVLSIMIPFKPRPVLQTHEPFAGRPIFNITYEWRLRGEPSVIADGGNIANLDMCSFNGYPVLTPPDANRKSYVFECQCVNGAQGSKCEWGGGCQPHDLFSLCSGHGECRYYRGGIKCICDKEHFGYRCEHPVTSGQPLQPPAQLVDMTVQLLDNHDHHFPEDQAMKLLKEACITVVNASYQNDSKEFHFAMNKNQRNCLPEMSYWQDALNSSVVLSLTEQDIVWVGPLNNSVEEGSLVLQCALYTSLFPVNISFFLGQHQIYNHEVDLCEGYIRDQDEGYISDGVVTMMLREDKDTTCTSNTTCSCSTNTTCTNDTICTITFLADRYDPDVDRGEFSVEVSQGNTSTRQSVMVDAKPRLLVVVQPLSASVYKNGNTTLTCTLTGDWNWNEDCEINWVFPTDSGIFAVETPAWNVSYLSIKHLKQSITVTCELAIWQFCDDRRNRTKSMCMDEECQPQVVTIHYLEPETLFCPTEKNGSVVWHITPVNDMSYSTCPEGFDGIGKRQCELKENGTAVWAEPDYYHCVYRPFNNLLQRPVMRYFKRGYHVTMDPNSTMEEIRQLFEARESMLLPREHSFIQDQLKYLLRPKIPPVDPLVFLGLFQEIRKKMAVDAIWQLQPLVRTYLSLKTSQSGYNKLDDLLLWVQEIPAEREVANFNEEYPQGEHSKRLRLDVTVPQGDRETVHVSTFMFLDLKDIPAHVYNTETSEEQVHELHGPAVEMVVVPMSNDLSFISERITLNMSYYDPDVTTDRNMCGGAKLSEAFGETVVWDLTRCTTLGQSRRRGRRAVRCHCRGPGLFAFIKMPEIQTDEPALKKLAMVALTCCIIILLPLVLLRIFLLSSASVRRRLTPGQNNAGSRLMNQLKTRITSFMPCVSADPDIIPDPDDRTPPPNPNLFDRPQNLDNLESCSIRTIENYAPMDNNSHQIAANIEQWRLRPMYENFPGPLESEHRQRWGSLDYVTPDSFHNLVVDTHESDPDESQC